MHLTRWIAVFLAAAVLAQCPGQSQTASPAQPLKQMPYSPSLDLNDMDKSVDPCVDFYKYACGGWMKSNPIPPDQPGWDVYAKLSDENAQFLWGILDADAKMTNRTPVQQKIGDYFSACMNESAINQKGMTPIEPLLAQIATIKDKKELTEYLARTSLMTGSALLFGAGSTQDPGNANDVIVGVASGGLGLPDRDYYTKTDAKSEEIRKKYVEYMTHLLVLAGEPQEKANADAMAVMQIETALAKASLTRVELRDPYKTYHKMTVAQLEELTPAIAWPKFFEGVGVGTAPALNVDQPEFMKALNAQIDGSSLETLKVFLRIHLLSSFAPALDSKFEQAQFDFFAKYLRGVPQLQPRWKRCERQVDRYMGEALGQEFVRLTFSAQTKDKTVQMTDLIEQSMQQEIEHLDWMSDATKAAAIQKLHLVRNKVGYPNQWRDYSSLTIKPGDYFGNVERAREFEAKREWAKVGKPVDRNEWGMSPPTVNAYYNPQMNDINFPAGVLQPPLYDPKEDDAPNYGNTGSTIGHELTHGFDDEGRQYDGNGNLKDWWTKQDAANFEDRINCLRDQFATYVIVDDIHINSKLTSGEDVADLGGTLLAYIAWKKATAGQDLKPVDGFTPDQRYFIGMAQWACENERPENQRVSAITNPHSPGFARINGIVINMPEFQKAFACKAGQPMFKEKMCRVW
jgi:putative endopeptidase